jgi:hypothetical protein
MNSSWETIERMISRPVQPVLINLGLVCMYLQRFFKGFWDAITFRADFLTGSERRYWIYQGQPWLGFIVGMALN